MSEIRSTAAASTAARQDTGLATRSECAREVAYDEGSKAWKT